VLVAVYGVAWIALEGNLARVTIFGCALSLLGLGYLFQRLLAGRRLSVHLWLLVSAALGVLFGFSCAVLTLLLMAVKTGLHAHGPEFNPAQIGWVVGQTPWWTSAGLLLGLGLGLIFAVGGSK
jgi:hypothetical protein